MTCLGLRTYEWTTKAYWALMREISWWEEIHCNICRVILLGKLLGRWKDIFTNCQKPDSTKNINQYTITFKNNIRLWAGNFYWVIVDEAEGSINITLQKLRVNNQFFSFSSQISSKKRFSFISKSSTRKRPNFGDDLQSRNTNGSFIVYNSPANQIEEFYKMQLAPKVIRTCVQTTVWRHSIVKTVKKPLSE